MYVAPLSLSSERLLEACDEAAKKPEHVQSIKSVSAHTLPTPNTTARLHMRPPTILDKSANTQSSSLREDLVVPEHQSYSEDSASGILALKKKTETTVSDPGIRKRVIDSITNLQDVSARVVKKGQLKKVRESIPRLMLRAMNNLKKVREYIVQGKRKRGEREQEASDEAEAQPKRKVKEKQAKANAGLKPGDAI